MTIVFIYAPTCFFCLFVVVIIHIDIESEKQIMHSNRDTPVFGKIMMMMMMIKYCN